MKRIPRMEQRSCLIRRLLSLLCAVALQGQKRRQRRATSRAFLVPRDTAYTSGPKTSSNAKC